MNKLFLVVFFFFNLEKIVQKYCNAIEDYAFI